MTHWSSRPLADWLPRTKQVTVSHDWISRLRRKSCLQPHGTDGFKFSPDPPLEAKIGDVAGLFLHPAQNAVWSARLSDRRARRPIPRARARAIRRTAA